MQIEAHYMETLFRAYTFKTGPVNEDGGSFQTGKTNFDMTFGHSERCRPSTGILRRRMDGLDRSLLFSRVLASPCSYLGR